MLPDEPLERIVDLSRVPTSPPLTFPPPLQLPSATASIALATMETTDDRILDFIFDPCTSPIPASIPRSQLALTVARRSCVRNASGGAAGSGRRGAAEAPL